MGALFTSFFLNPLFLIGALTAGIPVVIHMIYKKKAPRVLFSTVRFLKLSVERTAHRQRLQNLLLLLMRCLLFGLLAVAFAKPFVRPGGLFRGASANNNVVLVIDNSYSMACSHEGRTRYARAKGSAQQIIKGLGERDKAALVFTCGRESRSGAAAEEDVEAGAWAKYSVLSSDLDGIFEAVGSSQVSNERGNVLWSITKAREILAESDDPNKEIYVLSDMQALCWASSGKAGEVKGLASGSAPVVIVDCGREDYRNLSVTDVAVRAKGLAVGVPVTIEAKIMNVSASAQNTKVSLHIGKEKKQWRALDVEPGAHAIVSFNYAFDAPGPQTGRIVLETDDSLQTDNVRTFKVDVLERIKVLIVSETKSSIAFMNEGYYLANALDPFRHKPEETKSVIDPIECTRAELATRKLEEYAVVFCLNLPKLEPTHARMLAKYVADGGHLVFFLGPAVNIGNYHENLWSLSGLIADKGGLLPAKLEPAKGDDQNRTEPVGIGDVDTGHQIFSDLRQMPRSFYDGVIVYKWFPLNVPHGSPTLVLATLNNGWPLVVEKGFELGRVLMCCTSANAAWTNLPSRKLFLAMAHGMVYYLMGSRVVKGEYVAGSPVRFVLPRRGIALNMRITDPVGRVRQLTSDPDSEARVMVYDDTHAAGVYYCSPDKEVGDIRAGVFVVNPDPNEGDLKPIRKEDVKALLGNDQVYVVSGVAELDALTNRIREGIQIWSLLLFVVLGIAVFECFLANKKRPQAGVRMVGAGAAAGGA